jgi:hypothetical protein
MQQRKTAAFRITTMSKAEMAQLPSICAWEGCAEVFHGDMPHGWRWMLAYWSAQPQWRFDRIAKENMQRDCVLCPRHARVMDGELKPLCRLGPMPVLGEC